MFKCCDRETVEILKLDQRRIPADFIDYEKMAFMKKHIELRDTSTEKDYGRNFHCKGDNKVVVPTTPPRGRSRRTKKRTRS